MEKIAIITDSSCDLTREELESNNIFCLPFRIIYSYGEFEDGVTIQPDEVYANLEKEIPTTSLPDTKKIEELISKLEANGYTHIISINISSNLSGTLNSIRLVLEDHPNLTSFVYDTKTLTVAQGHIAIKAAEMIKSGKSFNEIIEALPKLRKSFDVYFTLSALEYLRKGGRIGKVAGTIGEFLNLKPVIYVADEGVYTTYAKLRGRKQSLNKLQEILKSYLAKGKCNLYLVEGHAKTEIKDFYEKVKDLPNLNNVNISTLGPALGVHTGPGLVGICIEKIGW